MVIAYYENRPETFEEVGNGSVLYNYDIEETSTTQVDGNPPRTGFRCKQVTVWKPITQEKVTEAVLSAFGANREMKLINEFNAAKFGLISGLTPAEIAARLKAYKDYLIERSELKRSIHEEFEKLK